MLNVNNIQNLDGTIKIKTNELVTFENGVLKSNNTDLLFTDNSMIEILRIDGDTKLTYLKNDLIDTAGSIESKTIVYEDITSNPFIKIIPKIYLNENTNTNTLIRLGILTNLDANNSFDEFLPSFIDGNVVNFNAIDINTNRIEFKILSDMNLIYSVTFDLFTYF